MLSSIAVLLLIQATLSYGYWISVNNGGPWGNWGNEERCPPNSQAIGFSLKVERPLGSNGDDTALNGIRLYCAAISDRAIVQSIASTAGGWGDWTSTLWCQGYLGAFSLQVEPSQGNGDDTAANNLEMLCSDGGHLSSLRGSGGPWGSFGSLSGTCSDGICGIKTRVEGPQGRGDDTALNDVQFLCC